jgi:hypothetical protein
VKSFPRLPLDDAIAREGVLLRQQHGLKSMEKIKAPAAPTAKG